jgi:transketolase
LVVALYFHQMRHRPEEPDWPDRDRFVLSKGHSIPAVYACLAMCGYFPVEELGTLKKLGSRLQGHPDMRKTCGVEASTGSLGMGLSVANGIALAGRAAGRSYRVYALLGDGECQEGQVWEAAMTTAHHQIDSLTVLVDHNQLQAMGPICDRMNIEPLVDKWRAFGWETWEIDGHDMAAIVQALAAAAEIKGRPTAIVARTVKGKGVPFMEGRPEFHNALLSEDDYQKAVAALESAIAACGE